LNELEALVILASIPHLGSIKIRLLLHYFGSAIEALAASVEEIARLPGFGPKISSQWIKCRQNTSWKENLNLAEHMGVDIIPFTSPRYPKHLLEISDHPVLLYMKGTLEKKDQRSIAIVGTRQASIYGLEMAEKFGYELTRCGFTVVSGLARGVDTAAHKGALQGGRTLAVIGSGLADIYPQENERLAQEIAQKGALISEFPMATPPDRQNFPQRNRIVSGMTMGTLLIEAPRKSGAMITMEKGLAQNRKLFALPGRADSEYFKGNHYLIKNGHAQLVECAGDIAGSFDDLLSRCIPNAPIPNNQILLEKEEQDLLNKMPTEEVSIEEIVQLTKLPIQDLNVLLLSLELKQVIKKKHGPIFLKIAGRR